MDDESGLHEEVELLKAIYLEDFSVHEKESGEISYLRMQLYPATGDNVEEKYVCLTLEFHLPSKYPVEVPKMIIRNPRGLADEHVDGLQIRLKKLAQERAGDAMLFELIELAKESLTGNNVPHGHCVICLEYLDEGDPFTKTDCYHYFHCGCLLRYVNHCHEEQERERQEIRQHKHMTVEERPIVCPICREPIHVDEVALQAQSGDADSDDTPIELSDEVRKLQREMAELYARQKACGGIIDAEAERNKYLLPSESHEPSDPTPQNLFHRPYTGLHRAFDSRMKTRDKNSLTAGCAGLPSAREQRTRDWRGLRDQQQQQQQEPVNGEHQETLASPERESSTQVHSRPKATGRQSAPEVGEVTGHSSVPVSSSKSPLRTPFVSTDTVDGQCSDRGTSGVTRPLPVNTGMKADSGTSHRRARHHGRPVQHKGHAKHGEHHHHTDSRAGQRWVQQQRWTERASQDGRPNYHQGEASKTAAVLDGEVLPAAGVDGGGGRQRGDDHRRVRSRGSGMGHRRGRRAWSDRERSTVNSSSDSSDLNHPDGYRGRRGSEQERIGSGCGGGVGGGGSGASHDQHQEERLDSGRSTGVVDHFDGPDHRHKGYSKSHSHHKPHPAGPRRRPPPPPPGFSGHYMWGDGES